MKKSELRQIIKEEIRSSLNEGIFGTSFDKEKRKIEDALDRWVKYSMDNGDSEANLLSVLEKYAKDAVHVYVGGKISDEDLLDKHDDFASSFLKSPTVGNDIINKYDQT